MRQRPAGALARGDDAIRLTGTHAPLAPQSARRWARNTPHMHAPPCGTAHGSAARPGGRAYAPGRLAVGAPLNAPARAPARSNGHDASARRQAALGDRGARRRADRTHARCGGVKNGSTMQLRKAWHGMAWSSSPRRLARWPASVLWAHADGPKVDACVLRGRPGRCRLEALGHPHQALAPRFQAFPIYTLSAAWRGGDGSRAAGDNGGC